MKVDYQKLAKNIKGSSIPKPVSGTLSGHAAGEPFDKYVYNLLSTALFMQQCKIKLD